MGKSILFDARVLVDPRRGGVTRVAELLAHEFVTKLPHHHVTFVTTGKKKIELPGTLLEHDHTEHIHIPIPNKVWSSLSLFGTISLDREVTRRTGKRFDLGLLPNIGFSGYMDIPYALVLHDLSFIIEPRWFPPRMRLWHQVINVKEQVRRAAHVFTVSETTAHDARKLLHVPNEKIEVFFPGIPALPNPESEPLVSGRYVLAIGETDPRKNVETVIEVVRMLRLQSEFEDVQLIIVGGAMSHDDNSFVSRLSKISDEELANLYKHASALLYPSWYEGFGLPLHEAAAFATPCLASVHGSLPETAPPGTLLLPPMKPHLWTSMLRDVLRSPQSYESRSLIGPRTPDIHGFAKFIDSV